VGAQSADDLLQPRVDPVNTGRPPDLIKESWIQERPIAFSGVAAMIKILLADDLEMVRFMLKGLCESEADFKVVGAVETGEAAIELALRTQPDVAVLDIKLPGISGLEVARRLTRRLPDIKIVVLTALDSYGFASRAMAAGAHAFLTKQAVVGELVNAIRKVYAGGSYLDSEIAQRVALAQIRDEGSPVDKLSDREIDVLLLMLRGHTTAEISDKLALAAKTVEHHRRSIRQKLNVTTDAQLGVVAGRYGLDPMAEGG
jgi:two-component system, NarL family, invasion response regulator UvrY